MHPNVDELAGIKKFYEEQDRDRHLSCRESCACTLAQGERYCPESESNWKSAVEFFTDIPRISDRCETRIVPSGALSNGKSRAACAAGVKTAG